MAKAKTQLIEPGEIERLEALPTLKEQPGFDGWGKDYGELKVDDGDYKVYLDRSRTIMFIDTFIKGKKLVTYCYYEIGAGWTIMEGEEPK